MGAGEKRYTNWCKPCGKKVPDDHACSTTSEGAILYIVGWGDSRDGRYRVVEATPCAGDGLQLRLERA